VNVPPTSRTRKFIELRRQVAALGTPHAGGGRRGAAACLKGSWPDQAESHRNRAVAGDVAPRTRKPLAPAKKATIVFARGDFAVFAISKT